MSERRESDWRLIRDLKAKNPIPVSDKHPNFLPFLHAAKEVRKQSEEHAESESRLRRHKFLPWAVYRKHMSSYFGDESFKDESYSGDFFNLLEPLREVVRTTHEQGKKAIAIDLLGEASGKSLGFDTTITVSLTVSAKPEKGIKPIKGSIFSSRTLEEYKQTLDTTEGELLLVYGDSVAGLDSFGKTLDADMEKHVYSLDKLLEWFTVTYDRLSDQGRIVLNMYTTLPKEAVERFTQYLKMLDIPYESKYSFILITKRAAK